MRTHDFSIRCWILAAGCAVAWGAANPPRTAVARVNGVAVTAGELETEVERLAPSAVPGHGKTANGPALRQKALDELIVRELAYQKAKQQKLTVPAAEMKATVAKIKGRYKSDRGFRDALKAEQIDEKEFLERVEKDLLLRKIYRLEVDDRSRVAGKEVDEYYRTHKARFVRPESVRLSHIWTKGDTPASRSKAQEAFNKIKSGTPFFDVAYRYSDDDRRVLGGDYGWVHRGQLTPEIEPLAFSAPAQTLVGPVLTASGWHVLRVEERHEQRQLTLAEVRGKIEESLHRDRLAQRRTEFVRSLKEHARIEYVPLAAARAGT